MTCAAADALSGPGARLAATIIEFLRLARDTERPAVGMTKLNKMLYYADFLYYKRTQKSLTEAVYRKQPFGIVPKAAFAIMDRLVREGYVWESSAPLSGKFTITRYELTSQEANTAHLLNDDQRDFIALVFAAYGRLSTSAIVLQSQREAPYLLTEMGARAPLTLSRFLEDIPA